MEETHPNVPTQPTPPSTSLAEAPHAMAIATPEQLLTLLKILHVEQTTICERLQVSRTPVSLWMSGKRRVPRSYASTLYAMATEALDAARTQAEATATTLESCAHQHALRTAFIAPIALWAHNVWYDQQQIVQGLRDFCEVVAQQAETYNQKFQSGQHLPRHERHDLVVLCEAMIGTLKTFAQLVEWQANTAQAEDAGQAD